MNVGVREFKAHISEYIDRAARGEVIRITDRGQARAILAPLPGVSRMEEGAREGWIHLGTAAPPRAVVRQRARSPSGAELEDDRADR